MIHSIKFTCVLDTNVIYPIEVRDLLFWFAYYELYTPKWSVHIFDEWKAVMKRKGLPEVSIRPTTPFPVRVCTSAGIAPTVSSGGAAVR